ncbi:MAG: hypothetical protein N2Z57_00715 [Oscillospiraceae bacterium]|nr:hypothetical protein [Oscillospiraceae bacterium]
MYSYTIWQWVLFFYIYSFAGWIIESVIVSVNEKRLVNRGFLRGPYLPLYGFGAISILFATLPVKWNIFLVYICGMASSTILEYFTGWLMETTLKMKYWDYSHQRFNFKGRISLISSLFWGVLSVVLTYFLHSPIKSFVLSIPVKVSYVIIYIISAIFIADAISAIRTAVDVNKLLENITMVKNEINNLKEQLSEKMENSEYSAKLKERLQELKDELSTLTEKIGFFKRQLIKAHPRAYSKYFNDALKEVRIKLIERRR